MFNHSGFRNARRSTLAAVALTLIVAGCGNTGGTGGSPADLTVPPSDGPGTCSVDHDCSGARAKCNVSSHTCVACLTDNDCPAAQVCDPATHACGAGCSANHGCGSDGGACEADAGVCVECLADRDCHDTARPRCDASVRRCVACLPLNDNCPKKTFCGMSGGNYSCLPGCRADADCALAPDAGAPADGGVPAALRCDVAKHACVRCLADDDCPIGQVCNTGACIAGCTMKHGCPNSLTCCSAQCTSTAGDVKNCGMCGNACQPKWACCGGGCSNPLTDLQNCGACGVVCAVANGTPKCDARGCGIGACNQGYDDCNAMYKDGCETHIDVDVANCGACGTACMPQHATPACVMGACTIMSCDAGYGDCDMDPKTGCEINLKTDLANCGKCMNVCPAQNGTPACNAGTCAIKCNPGFAHCSNNPATGCETNTNTDSKNCGACGTVCPNGIQCTNGVCPVVCGGYVFNGGCWYTSALNQSCGAFCMAHGGFDAVNAKHMGNPICTHFYPLKANGGNWMTVECCSTDNNTNWGATGAAPDPNFMHAACYLACACNN